VSEPPSDVESVLCQLLAEAREALPEDRETAAAAVDSVETVARTKLPEGERRERLLFGCHQLDRLLGDPDAVETADAYLEAMERRV
jgi:hypothetical protein